jgi:hypothetical protein
MVRGGCKLAIQFARKMADKPPELATQRGAKTPLSKKCQWVGKFFTADECE